MLKRTNEWRAMKKNAHDNKFVELNAGNIGQNKDVVVVEPEKIQHLMRKDTRNRIEWEKTRTFFRCCTCLLFGSGRLFRYIFTLFHSLALIIQWTVMAAVASPSRNYKENTRFSIVMTTHEPKIRQNRNFPEECHSTFGVTSQWIKPYALWLCNAWCNCHAHRFMYTLVGICFRSAMQ